MYTEVGLINKTALRLRHCAANNSLNQRLSLEGRSTSSNQETARHHWIGTLLQTIVLGPGSIPATFSSNSQSPLLSTFKYDPISYALFVSYSIRLTTSQAQM